MSDARRALKPRTKKGKRVEESGARRGSKIPEGNLRIAFADADVSASPLRVLRHLYFYTAQYGLSVRQFTGHDTDYWAALPARLRAAGTSRRLEAILRGSTRWRPARSTGRRSGGLKSMDDGPARKSCCRRSSVPSLRPYRI